MSNCSCSIDGYDGYDECTLIKWTIPKARKQHRCCECRKPIEKGERYYYESIAIAGGVDNIKTCLDCISVRDSFFCSWTYTELWEAFKNYLEENDYKVPDSCMSKLTERAKDMVCELIQKHFDESEEEERLEAIND